MWDVYTEERLGDTGFCRVYAAKVNGKRALVKEFYGKNAMKAWLATAKFHAATHFAPEILHLMGASSTWEETNDEDVGTRPFLLLEWDDLRPWKPQEIPPAARTMQFWFMGIDAMNVVYSLMDTSIPTSIKPQDIEVYERPVRRCGLSSFQPVVAFNSSGLDEPTSEVDKLRLLRFVVRLIFEGQAAIEQEGSDFDKEMESRIIKAFQETRHGLLSSREQADFA